MARFGKLLLRGLLFIGGSLVILLLAATVLLKLAFSPSRDEVLRVKSPSGDLVAIVYEVNGGATTSFAYEVYVDSSGFSLGSTKVAYIYDAIRNNKGAHGVNPRWASNDELHIEYLSSRSDEVISPANRVFGPPIRVVLKVGVTDASAPMGGMLYNLSK